MPPRSSELVACWRYRYGGSGRVGQARVTGDSGCRPCRALNHSGHGKGLTFKAVSQRRARVPATLIMRRAQQCLRAASDAAADIIMWRRWAWASRRWVNVPPRGHARVDRDGVEGREGKAGCQPWLRK